MTIAKTNKRAAVTDRPQRRRSGLKAAPTPAAPRAGRRAPPAGRAAAAAAGAPQASNVRVVVRVRPENERERQGNYRMVVRPLDDHMLIFDPRQQDEDFYFQGVRQRQRDLNKRASKDMQYMFDRVFHQHHTNQQLFDATTKDVIDTVIEGFNCSVFAYGSTGAGKTHTMLGTSSEPGIVFLTVMELYTRIEAMADTRCQVAVSYVEVYNETVTDLLHPSGPLDVREDGQRAVVITGLSQSTPDGPDHLMAILEAGNKNRTQHPTDMNAESSRSHAVFQVVLRQSDSTAGLSTDVRLSKLSLIDLAGSERGSATGHKGARFREGANINRSLLALGSCINALADGKKFVPYRDSKLTRLLKDSIGGNCKTVMIANVTPSAASYEDTHNTLKYADRAKAIKTRLQRNVVSVDMHVAQYAKIVDELRLEVTELKARLAEPPPAEAPAAPFDASPLRAAEAARRALVSRQLQLEAEAHQLRLRLHRRRLCAQRAALLRPAGAARPDRQQDRLAGRLSQAHVRLEKAREELAAAVQEAEREAAQAPPGAATDQLAAQLATELHLDECRVHAAHLEAVSRLQQLELAASDHLLAQLISACREQYRVLGFMKFVTPELEAQYQDIVGLVEGQKEVCWADQQVPPADSPGQPSYDVAALLRLADTSYQPAEPARHAIGSPLRPADGTRAGPPANRLPDAPEKAPSPRHGEGAGDAPRRDVVTILTPAGGQEAVAAGGGATPRLPGLLPLAETTPLPPPSYAEPALAACTPAGDVTLSLDAVLPPGDTTLGCGATDEVLITVGALAQREETPCRPRGQRAPSPVIFDAEAGLETPQPASSAGPAAPKEESTGSPAEGEEGSAQTRLSGSPGPEQSDRDLPDVAVSAPSPLEISARPRPSASPDSAGQTRSPGETGPALNDTLTLPSPRPPTVAANLNATQTLTATENGSASNGLDATRTQPNSEHSPAPVDLNATVTLLSSNRKSASPDLNVTVNMPSSIRKPSSPNLNATVTLPSSIRKPASPDLNVTVTMPSSIRKPSSPNLYATVTLPSSIRKSTSPDLNVTVTMPSSIRKPSSPNLNATVTLPSSIRKSTSPDLNATQTLSPSRRSPAAFDLNATQTLSAAAACLSPVPAAPFTSAALPSFERSPIPGDPAAAAVFAPLPDLPPTPEILRRTRTPLKARAAAAPSPTGLDSTFTMQPPFRLASAAEGVAAAAAGGGHRALAGRAAVRAAAPGNRTGLDRSSSAVQLPQAGRTGAKRPPGAAPRWGHDVRMAAAAPNPSRLSLSAQKSRSTSRLQPNTSASGGRDENHKPRGADQSERHGWGRTTAPAPLLSAGRHGLISSVGKFGLGRNRAGGMTKSRSEAILKPANS